MFATSRFPYRKLVFPLVLAFIVWAFFVNPASKEIAAGVAILLFGLIMLEDGFNTFAQGPLQHWLRKGTDNPFKAWFLGFTGTTILQSSALIGVLVLSFLSAGMMTLPAGIAMVFGSNVGTTVSAWVVSIWGFKMDIAGFALPILVFGIVFVLQNSKALKGVGYVLAGVGFFFLGIHFIQEGFHLYGEDLAMEALVVESARSPWLYLAIGTVLTVVMQSSSAFLVLILTMLAMGKVDYTNALSLTVGSNVGSTVIVLVGSIKSNRDGKRLAVSHFSTKLVVAVAVMIFLDPLGELVEFISGILGVDSDDYPLKLSVFHTLFNVLVTLLLFPFIGKIAKFARLLVPDPPPAEDEIQPKHLTESVLHYPQTAIRALLDESKHLFDVGTFTVVAHGLNIHRSVIKGRESIGNFIRNSTEEFDIDIENMYYNKVKAIYVNILEYSTRAESIHSLTPRLVEVFGRIKLASRNQIEIIKNIRGLRKNINQYMQSDNEYIREEYNALRRKVAKTLRLVYRMGVSDDPASFASNLDIIKKEAVDSDLMKSGVLGRLINEDRITGAMAASLANDSAVVSGIILKLVETAELLYIDRDNILRTAEKEAPIQS